MKRIILSAIIALGALAASAQVVNASQPRLLDGVTGDGSVISPDGKYVVTSTARGIERIPFGGGEAAVVSDVMGAYKLAVSPDGNNVVFRRAQVGEDHMRRVSLENVDMRTGRANVVIAPTRNMDAGFTLKGNAVTAVTDGKVLATRLTAPAAGKKAAPAKPAPLATIHYGHLQMTVDGVTTTLDPLGEGSYLWPSVSPDGTRVLFHLVGRGVFTANIDGTDVKAVHPRLVMPVWAGNDVVLGTVTSDDGVNFLTGVLTAVSVADGATQDLTGADIIALDPSASADGSRAVFTTPAGAVYTLTLK